MKLRSVDVIGLFGIYSHHIELSDEGLTFIHSLNGMGKSTTMKLICDLYTGNLQSVASVQFDRMILRFDNDVIITVVNDDGVKVMMETPEQTKELFESDLMVMFSVIYLSPERNVLQMLDGRLMLSIDMMMTGFRTIVETANDDLQPYAEHRDEVSVSEFLDWCRDIDDELQKMRAIHICPNIPEDVRFPPEESDYLGSKKRYEDLAYSIQQWIEKYEGLYTSAQTFIDIINGLFTEKRLIVTDKCQLMAVMGSGERQVLIPPNRLSAGEKQLLVIFFRIIFKAEKGSLVILDEPEISLHVSWQQKLGAVLLDLCKSKDIQMLVATHSPMIIHDRWDLAMELRPERA